MLFEVIKGICIPFLGTSLGAACVFFMKSKINESIQRAIIGFSAGVMVAASIWSLLIPAMEQSQNMGKLAFVPAVVGFWIGVVFLMLLGRIATRLHQKGIQTKNIDNVQKIQTNNSKHQFGKKTMFVLAIVLHNIPEGMAVGVCFAGFLSGNSGILLIEAIVLAIGIAIQNIPEGAIISMPMKMEGSSKKKSFLAGVLSGVVEPIAAFSTILLLNLVVPLLPYLLSFAAGAMIYVVAEELIPEMHSGKKSSLGVIGVTIGFVIMMVLDIALG